MPKVHNLTLRVREADEYDYSRSIIRMHPDDKPSDLKWDNAIQISTDRRKWVTCKLKPAGATGIGHIYMDVPTRTKINFEAIATQMARINEPFNFYLRKAFPMKWVILFFFVLIIIILAVLYYSDVIDFNLF